MADSDLQMKDIPGSKEDLADWLSMSASGVQKVIDLQEQAEIMAAIEQSDLDPLVDGVEGVTAFYLNAGAGNIVFI